MKKCRIINGALKHRYIIAPEGSQTRPTSDIVKQSIFNVLIHRFCFDFESSFVIDLFAGSGSLGIEAISLGCTNTLFVDSNKVAIQCITKNIQSLKIEGFSNVICHSAKTVPDSIFVALGDNFSNILAFLDPPYAEKELLYQQISRFSMLFKRDHFLLVAESNEENESAKYVIRHGDTIVNFIANF